MNLTSAQITALDCLKKALVDKAHQLGFADCRIGNTDLGPHPDYLQHWLAQGYQGEMQWMERNHDLRTQPDKLHPQTLRLISLRMDYLPADTQPLTILNNPAQAYVSRYALGRDYHKLIRKRLAQLADFLDHQCQAEPELAELFPQPTHRGFTDSAPVLERGIAERAGLGWIGKNCMLIHPQAGSWFFLAELYTSLPLPIDPPTEQGHCGECQRCLQVCPTQALVKPGLLDARRCISYLTIEHPGVIPETLRAAIGNRIYGCDDCQLFCPWTRFSPTSDEKDFQPRHELDQSSLLTLFQWSEAEFLEKTQGSAIRRIGYERWQRNLAIALGNGPKNPAVIEALEQANQTASALVSEHLRWALDRLQSRE